MILHAHQRSFLALALVLAWIAGSAQLPGDSLLQALGRLQALIERLHQRRRD